MKTILGGIVFYWVYAFILRKMQGNYKVITPGWLSCILFFHASEKPILLQSILLQIWTYCSNGVIIGLYFLGIIDFAKCVHWSYDIFISTMFIILALYILDAIIGKLFLKNLKK
jgi:hypothetical protein